MSSMNIRNRNYCARMRLVASVLVGLLTASSALANVKLPSVLSSHMVLQQEMPIVLWGSAEPGESVTVKFAETSETATANEKGHWQVTLPPHEADSEPRRMSIVGKNRIELEDVLVGEVWLGSGQSNMEMPMTEAADSQEAIAASDHPQIRLFHITHAQAELPAKDVDATWRACTPDNVATFSAALYFFGQRLQQELQVPIGLINASWGGSPIEQWTPKKEKNGQMYNGMVAPLVPFAIRGVTWYQGEANVRTNQGMEYRRRMEDLIGGWRSAWGRELPWYFVQIAPWDYSGYLPGQVPVLWEAQVASLKIPKTGMVVTTDLSDPSGRKTGHPLNKRDVGKRLARWALAKTYGRNDIVYSGPLYKSSEIEGSRMRLHFAHTEGGLKANDGGPLREFEIAGEHGHFVAARAEIEGDSVVVWADYIPEPTQVRFGWHTLANPNLSNGEGLPASPFQTKDWQGGTAE